MVWALVYKKVRGNVMSKAKLSAIALLLFVAAITTTIACFLKFPLWAIIVAPVVGLFIGCVLLILHDAATVYVYLSGAPSSRLQRR